MDVVFSYVDLLLRFPYVVISRDIYTFTISAYYNLHLHFLLTSPTSSYC